MKIKISESDLKFIKNYANIIATGRGDIFAYIPQWFKLNEDGTMESFSFEYLPKEVIEIINRIKEPNT